jgi:AAA15 family ATPase/GTPase
MNTTTIKHNTHIKTITIKKYRNFENKTLEFTTFFNLIVGKSGSGKTNLLRAISNGLRQTNSVNLEFSSSVFKTPLDFIQPFRYFERAGHSTNPIKCEHLEPSTLFKTLSFIADIEAINIKQTTEEDSPVIEIANNEKLLPLDKILSQNQLLFLELINSITFWNKYAKNHGRSFVVLIDEIEAHLHPNQQRGLTEFLHELFPDAQFFITTNSPFIVQSFLDLYNRIEKGQIIRLDNIDQEIDYSLNTIEEISEEILGIEIPQQNNTYLKMVKKAQEYYLLLEQAKTTEDEEKLSKLKKELDILEQKYIDNPAFHAFLRMERLATIGEINNYE